MKILIVLPWMKTINIAFMKVYLITSQSPLTFIILYHGLNSILTAALSSIFHLIFPAYVSLYNFLSLSCNLIYFPCLLFFFSYLYCFDFTFFFYFFFLFFLFNFFIFFTFSFLRWTHTPACWNVGMSSISTKLPHHKVNTHNQIRKWREEKVKKRKEREL